jgi:hypothetical protein
LSFPTIVSHAKWQVAMDDLLAPEHTTRARDARAAQPQSAPYQWWRRHDEYDPRAADAGPASSGLQREEARR